jgi:hypothetical protein
LKTLGLVIALGGVAMADAPPGRYQLAPKGDLVPLQSSINPPVTFPSCGQAALDFFHGLRLVIEAGTAAFVNGEAWPDAADHPPGHWVVERVDPQTGFHVHLMFSKDDKTTARGGISIARIGKQKPGRSARLGVLCADGIRLAGRYRSN